MRISSAGALLLLAACSSDASDVPPPDDESRIECALAGAAAFARDCWIERRQVDGQPILIVRHPDGGFRRFEVAGGETSVTTADGAQAAEVTFRDGRIDVAVGTDRYRLPRTLSDDRR